MRPPLPVSLLTFGRGTCPILGELPPATTKSAGRAAILALSVQAPGAPQSRDMALGAPSEDKVSFSRRAPQGARRAGWPGRLQPKCLRPGLLCPQPASRGLSHRPDPAEGWAREPLELEPRLREGGEPPPALLPQRGPSSTRPHPPAPGSAASPGPGWPGLFGGQGTARLCGGVGGWPRGRDHAGAAWSWPGVAAEPGAGLTVEGASGRLRGERGAAGLTLQFPLETALF